MLEKDIRRLGKSWKGWTSGHALLTLSLDPKVTCNNP